MLAPQKIIDLLQMQPNSDEGGYFASTYTSATTIANTSLLGFIPVSTERPICSAIYYLLKQGTCSVMHRVKGDMLYHFYSGDPVQMLLLFPENYPKRYEICNFSNDLASGGYPMKTIPAGTWLGSRLVPKSSYALMGVTMAPGFDPKDYSIGERKDLINAYPDVSDLIIDLTH